MLQLTAPQATLIVAVVGLAGGLVGWLGRGIAFLVRRWWTGAPRQEHAAYLNSVADLAGKLRATGMTISDIQQLEVLMRSTAVVSSPAATELVESIAKDTPEPDAFHSNAAMKARTGAAYDVAEAHLEQALMDLRLLMPEAMIEVLDAAQDRWREYRRALEDFALREFEGGTHAPLAMTLTGLAETERRTAELRVQIDEWTSRYG